MVEISRSGGGGGGGGAKDEKKIAHKCEFSFHFIYLTRFITFLLQSVKSNNSQFLIS